MNRPFIVQFATGMARAFMAGYRAGHVIAAPPPAPRPAATEPEPVEHEHGDGAIELRRITITEFLTTEGKQLSAAVFQGDDFTDVQKLGLLEFAKTVPITDLVLGACDCEEHDDE